MPAKFGHILALHAIERTVDLWLGGGLADSLASALICVAFVATAILIVLGSYFITRRLLGAGIESDRTYEVSSSVGGRVATLYGLILALVYAQELSDYKDIRAALSEETTALADVFNDAHRYGGPETTAIQTDVSKYVAAVLEEEWDRLGDGKGLSSRAWKAWDSAYNRVLNLIPSNDRQRFLANRLRDRITAVARLRQMREASIGQSFSGVFWPPALLGLALLSIPFYVYKPSRSHLILLSVFGAYSGIILFFIFAFSNPFQKPARIEPVAFEHLQIDFHNQLSRDSN